MGRTNESLWEKVKLEVILGGKGGLPGKWSARKAQLAVKIYKDRGGGYEGMKPRDGLAKWTREDWNYAGQRYLPRAVRERLTRSDIAAESRRKSGRKGEYVPYGEKVTGLMRKLNIV
ncbi:MAG: hypothetical protein ACOYNN_13470 [Terrimicrobiaceae bacterium]